MTPGKPMQNDFFESWRCDYNEVRPHSAIGDRPPMALINALGEGFAGSEMPKVLG